jgi:hypothetical protein
VIDLGAEGVCSMTRTEKLIVEIRNAITPELGLQIKRLERKVIDLERQRNEWKAQAMEYRQRLIDRKPFSLEK